MNGQCKILSGYRYASHRISSGRSRRDHKIWMKILLLDLDKGPNGQTLRDHDVARLKKSKPLGNTSRPTKGSTISAKSPNRRAPTSLTRSIFASPAATTWRSSIITPVARSTAARTLPAIGISRTRERTRRNTQVFLRANYAITISTGVYRGNQLGELGLSPISMQASNLDLINT